MTTTLPYFPYGCRRDTNFSFFNLRESIIAYHTCLYCKPLFHILMYALNGYKEGGEPWNTLVCPSEDKETGSCRDLASKASIHINKSQDGSWSQSLSRLFPQVNFHAPFSCFMFNQNGPFTLTFIRYFILH